MILETIGISVATWAVLTKATDVVSPARKFFYSNTVNDSVNQTVATLTEIVKNSVEQGIKNATDAQSNAKAEFIEKAKK